MSDYVINYSCNSSFINGSLMTMRSSKKPPVDVITIFDFPTSSLSHYQWIEFDLDVTLYPLNGY